MGCVAIVNGVYKPTCNWGASPFRYLEWLSCLVFLAIDWINQSIFDFVSHICRVFLNFDTHTHKFGHLATMAATNSMRETWGSGKKKVGDKVFSHFLN